MNNPKKKHLSLLDLPVELRNAIYEHLIPNHQVLDYWFISRFGGPPDRRPVRHDEQKCCPAILRINRQIHHEVIGMFYGTALFLLTVGGRGCYVFGRKFHTNHSTTAPAKVLPPGFRFLRSLFLTVSLNWRQDIKVILDPSKSRPGTTLL